MAHFREQDDAGDIDLRNALDDARVLMERYQKRNDPQRQLTPAQRQAWAEQMVVVLGELGRIASTSVNRDLDDRVRRRMWVQMFEAGYRPAKPLPQDPPDLRVAATAERRPQRSGRGP